MTTQQITETARPTVKQINYISKTFGDFRQNLIDFARAYYPNTYTDFNEASPGMMFIEMASYVGDVLSFYIDNSFKENLLAYAEQQDNVVTLSQFLGYKPKLSSPASTTATLYQIVPAVLSGGLYIPDPRYLIKIGAGSTFSAEGPAAQPFTLTKDVDFTNISSIDYTIYSTDGGGNPSQFLVTKIAEVIAATIKTETFSFSSTPVRFNSVELPDNNVIGIVNAVDSLGNTWYEVDYLAQDVIMEDLQVTNNGEAGILPSAGLRLKRVPRRFVTRINNTLKTELLFGGGITGETGIDYIVDSRQIATSQYGNTIQNQLANVSLNNINYMDSNSYGMVPAGISITVTYWIGGGVTSNTPSNTIINVQNLIILNDTSNYSQNELSIFSQAVNSVTIRNQLPATGGGDGESLDEIKQNALAFFNAQNRVVTVEDYVTRAYAMPAKYGTIAKAFAIRDEQINRIQSLSDISYVDNPVRPNSINLYTLGYDKDGKLETLNSAVKQNLARYLEQYRMLTDDVNILDAFVINIGVKFDISVFSNYNISDVIARSIGTVQNFFDIRKWSIGQPIILSDLIYQIGSVDGVQTVQKVEIFNKYQFQDGPSYKEYRYDINAATQNGVIYTSLDPSIFELKNPSTDIIGNAIQ